MFFFWSAKQKINKMIEKLKMNRPFQRLSVCLSGPAGLLPERSSARNYSQNTDFTCFMILYSDAPRVRPLSFQSLFLNWYVDNSIKEDFQALLACCRERR